MEKRHVLLRLSHRSHKHVGGLLRPTARSYEIRRWHHERPTRRVYFSRTDGTDQGSFGPSEKKSVPLLFETLNYAHEKYCFATPVEERTKALLILAKKKAYLSSSKP